VRQEALSVARDRRIVFVERFFVFKVASGRCLTSVADSCD